MAQHVTGPVDVVRRRAPFRAHAHGQQFLTTMIALNNGHGLFEVPIGLAEGELLVLRPMGPEAKGLETVQLFGKMERAHKKAGLYILGWERVVCPDGSVELMEFLQKWLGVSLTDNSLCENPIVGEMVTFDFRNQVLASPRRGKNNTSVVKVDSAIMATPKTLPSEAPTPPLPQRPGQKAPARPAQPVRPAEKVSQYHVPDEDEDGPVEMFGMKISKNDWERLDNIGFVQTDPKTRQPRRVRSAPSSPPPEAQSEPESQAKKPSKWGGFMRKMAEKLSEE